MNEVNNNSSPTISVIVPVYNAENTLHHCVDSILNQEYKYLELILVDDGSKDNSPAICDEYATKDPRVIVIHKENGGVSSARNEGLNIAKGKWITFIDADDYIKENFFNVPLDTTFDLILGNIVWKRGDRLRVDNRMNIFWQENNHQITSILNKFLTTTYFRGPISKFYRRSLIDNIRFDEEMKVGEDACFVHQYLIFCHSLLYVNQSEYVIRISEEAAFIKYGCSTKYAIKSLNKIFKTFQSVANAHFISPSLFNKYLMYFKMVCKEDWCKKPSRWYRNKNVQQMYKYLWPYLTRKLKTKYILARWFSW